MKSQINIIKQALGHKTNIAVIGDIILDAYVYGVVERISPEAPIPVLKKSGTYYRLGGSANVAANVKSLGGNVILIGNIGTDESGSRIRELLKIQDIQDGTFANSNLTTTTKTRFIHRQQQQVMRLDHEEKIHLSETDEKCIIDQLTSVLHQIDCVLISDYDKGFINASIFNKIAKLCKKFEIDLLVDPKSPDWRKYKGATLIKPNLLEFKGACLAAGVETDYLTLALTKMSDLHETDILLTLSKDGMMYYSAKHNELQEYKSEAREVFDVSGAGDTVLAALGRFWSQRNMSGLNVFKLSNYAASAAVRRAGTYVVQQKDLLDEINTTSETKAAPIFAPSDTSVLEELRSKWNEENYKIGFTNGCFDLIHSGHIQTLSKAKAIVDKLIVAVNSDQSVKKLKGNERPILSEIERSYILASFNFVDAVVLFEEETPLKLIEFLRPDVLIKGGDYKIEDIAGSDFVESIGGSVVTIDYIDGKSTTEIINKLKGMKL